MDCTRDASNKQYIDDDASVSSKTSSIAFECHSRLFLEELSAMVDDEGSDYDSEDEISQGEEEKRGEEVIEDNEDKDGILNQDIRCRHNYANSEISLDSILEDDTVSLVRRREACIVDREVRAGSQLFRSRSDVAFARTGSVLGRVIRSASGRILHAARSSDRIGPGGSSGKDAIVGKNAIFKHATGGASNSKARDAGRALLVDFAPSNRCGGRDDAVSAASDAGHPNFFKESLDSANFMKLLNGLQEEGQSTVSCQTGTAAVSMLWSSFGDTSLSSLERRFGEPCTIVEENPSIVE